MKPSHIIKPVNNLNLINLNKYIAKNMTTMQNIITNEFESDVESGYAI
jgi:hypothetical protein